MMTQVGNEQIIFEIQRLRELRLRCETNYFGQFAFYEGDVFSLVTSSKAMAFSVMDNGVQRLFYFGTDRGEIAQLLREFASGSMLNILSRCEMEVKPLALAAGCVPFSRFVRVSNPHLVDTLFGLNSSEYAVTHVNFSLGRQANVQEAERISRLLFSTFDTRTSHIPPVEEICRQIEEGTVWVREEDGELTSLLMYRIEGKKYYINQVINRAKPQVIHGIVMYTMYNAIQEHGISYSYAWIDEKNLRSLRFHARYDMVPDGLFDFSYIHI